MPKKKPLITVGIPVYNVEKFIASAIKSVLNQTFTDFELIITDDGSTDETENIVRTFNDTRIRYIRDGENRGISYRLNQQICLARGEYFCRMDGDDIMLPWRLHNQLQYLQQNPNVDIIGSGAFIIEDNNTIIGARTPKRESQITTVLWEAGRSFIHPTVFGKTEFFKRYQYCNDLIGVEDMDLWYRASKDSTLVCIPEIVLCYREPLKLKLGTYLFRQKQTRKFWIKPEVKQYFGLFRSCLHISKSYIKSLIALLVFLTQTDSKFIRRRNSSIDEDSQIYKETLVFLKQLGENNHSK